jgi:two-component system, chemotaxis family, protein-glutamate methylesterase/glutaminase
VTVLGGRSEGPRPGKPADGRTVTRRPSRAPGGPAAGGRESSTTPVRVVIAGAPGPARALLVRALEADGDISVVGEAVVADDVVALVEGLRPDVVVLDFLKRAKGRPPEGGDRTAGRPEGTRLAEQVMGRAPTPILALLGPPADQHSDHGAQPAPDPATEMIMAGAAVAVSGPVRWSPAETSELREQVRKLRGMTVLRHPRGRLGAPAANPGRRQSSRLVAIAASTGGPAALATVLAGIAGVQAPVLLLQHIHADFVDGLVSWMQRVAPVPVRLAADGDHLDPGVVYIGPGNVHLKVAVGLWIVLDPEPAATHRPSADELFRSVAEVAGARAIGVVLTGMGNDGADGLLAIRNAGGLTIAQDEATSAVFGMPHAAHLAGAVMHVLPLEKISAAIVAATQGQPV